MKMKLAFLLLTAACAQAFCGVLENSSGVLYYPAIGTVNRNEGTIQITMTPNIDLNHLKDGWPFAIRLSGVGEHKRPYAALGIYSIADGGGMSVMMRALKGRHYAVVSNCRVDSKAGIPVNMTQSWGPKGFFFYVNGKKIGSCRFDQPMIPTSPFLFVGRMSPFYVSRVMVTTRQLDEKELQNDPKKDFKANKDTSLLANDLNKPQFFITDAVRRENLVTLVPFDLTAGHLFFDDETAMIRCTSNNVTAKPVTRRIAIQLTAIDGKIQKLERSVTIAPNTLHKDVYVPLAKLKAGFYKVDFNVEKHVPNSFYLSIQPRIAGKTGAMEEYLGTAQNNQPEIHKKLGIRWVRSWGMPYFLWNQIEPVQGKFDFQTADRIVDGHLKNGVKTLGLLGYPPQWAAVEPDWSKDKRYSKAPGRWKPRSVAEWNNYVAKTAAHFKGRVTHYEIYNECDFKTPGYPASFSGSTEEYFELLKGASREIHAADKANKVLITGFSMMRGPVDENMPSDLLKMGAADQVDIWNLHCYQVFVKVDEMKKMVGARRKMPFWQTEHMWHMLKDEERLRYVSAAIPFWFVRKGFDKFFTFGWGEYLSNENSQSLRIPLHTFGVIQQFLRISDRYLGNVRGLPATDFDTYEQFRTTDGKYFSAFGSSAGNYEVEIGNRDAVIHDECGRLVPLKNGKVFTDGRLLLVLTEKPLEVKSFRLAKMKDLLYNKDFEQLGGDAFAGIEHCTPAGWTLRHPDDPKAKFRINTKQANGSCAVEIQANSVRRGVYLFEEPRFVLPGIYRISANFKLVSGKLEPFFHIYGRDVKDPLRAYKTFPAVKADGKFHKVEFDFEVKNIPDTTTAVIIGVHGTGTVILDDADLVRLDIVRIPKGKELQLKLNSSALQEWKSGRRFIDFGLFKSLPKKMNVKGIPFRSPESIFAVAGKSWKGRPETASVTVPKAKYKGIYFLAAGMYCSGKKNTLLAHITLTSASGKKQIIHLREGDAVADWYSGDRKPMKTPDFTFDASNMQRYNLYLAELRNPLDGEELVRIDLTARNNDAIVAIPAITLEK